MSVCWSFTVLAIVTVFVARHNGLRSAANRRRRREVAQEVQGFKRFKKEVKKLSAGKVQRIHGRKRKYQTRMNDLLKGYSSNFAANRKKFKMKLRSKKDPQQSITILSKHWGKSCGEY